MAAPRVVLGAAGVAVAALVTAAAVSIMHPDLAQMPPVIRMPAAAGRSPATPVQPDVTSPAPAPSPTRSRRPVPASPRPPQLRPILLGYEAEMAVRDSATIVWPLDGASGGQVVGNIGRHRYHFVRFTQVVVPDTGRYTLTVYYICADPQRDAVLTVNGTATTRRFAGTGGLTRVGSVAFAVDLRAGANTIEFGNVVNTWAPDLDRITISR